jgi:hypothetical protein
MKVQSLTELGWLPQDSGFLATETPNYPALSVWGISIYKNPICFKAGKQVAAVRRRSAMEPGGDAVPEQ